LRSLLGARRDFAAFQALLERNAEMVLGVCRRVLRQTQDAEDACQAVFLILARRAGAIVNSDSVASWLYGVALRTASNLRRANARRKRREQNAADLAGSHAANPDAAPHPLAGREDLSLSELRGVLDEELARIPCELRSPLVLCFLEGKTRDEAAAVLGWSVSLLKGRLSQAR